MNTLYYGDNLKILRDHIKDESIEIRDLGHTVDREKAAIGVFLTLEKPSRDMTTEAVGTGFYEPEHFGKFPKLQILTVEELLNGNTVKLPPSFLETFKQADKIASDNSMQTGFDFD